ncbi:hypothetical protein MYE70_11150 [Marinobacter alexandrii]|uniref:hypothetical protein n=1 Tax=Marinobacter TaxID=2742 RepID=UPI001107C588|nr:hypothetical protein [Marinobacter alexandrii]MCK2149614.1 hypothetical protein [Marinobacter alexandrii]
MPTIRVFPFTYYDAEQGVRREGAGMCTEESIRGMREKDPTKDHQVIESRSIEIHESDLSETGRYYPPPADQD